MLMDCWMCLVSSLFCMLPEHDDGLDWHTGVLCQSFFAYLHTWVVCQAFLYQQIALASNVACCCLFTFVMVHVCTSDMPLHTKMHKCRCTNANATFMCRALAICICTHTHTYACIST